MYNNVIIDNNKQISSDLSPRAKPHCVSGEELSMEHRQRSSILTDGLCVRCSLPCSVTRAVTGDGMKNRHRACESTSCCQQAQDQQKDQHTGPTQG